MIGAPVPDAENGRAEQNARPGEVGIRGGAKQIAKARLRAGPKLAPTADLGKPGEQQGIGAVGGFVGDHRGRTAGHPGVVLGERAEGLDSLDNGRVVERHAVRRPLVVDFRRLRAQHQVLDPVGCRPARRAARAETDAPWRAAVGHDGEAERSAFLDAPTEGATRWVWFQVRDQGIGIPLEDQQRLFETFHRARNVGSIAGTGLGLAIVKQSLDLHGGSIHLHSEAGQGTCFTVDIPLSARGSA